MRKRWRRRIKDKKKNKEIDREKNNGEDEKNNGKKNEE